VAADVLNVERWFSPDTVQALRKMGYHVQFGLREGSDAGSYWSDAECIASTRRVAIVWCERWAEQWEGSGILEAIRYWPLANPD